MSMQIPLASLNMNTLANLVPLSAEICGCLGENVKKAGDVSLLQRRYWGCLRLPHRGVLDGSLYVLRYDSEV